MSAIKRHPDKITGRTVLLIAGTGGIGKGVASALVSRGAKVIITSTRQEKLDVCISELKSLYPERKVDVTGYTLDLGSSQVEDNIKQLVSDLEKDGVSKLDHLAYIAGDPLPVMDLQDITLDSWLKASQVRTISCILCIKHLVPLLQASLPATVDSSPSIILTGGGAADKPPPGGWTLICMIAGSLQSAARVLALELKPIRVNIIAPGLVDTDLWQGMSAEEKKGLEQAGAKNPTGRMGDVRDVAESYIGLMADGNITGETIRTNSGSMLI